MKIIFCCDPLEPKLPDAAFRHEANSAERVGLEMALIDFELLTGAADPARATRRVPDCAAIDLAIYRGWMLKPEQYRQLFEVLMARGVRLINDPTAYRHCHLLPESYAKLVGHTPTSVWMRLRGELPMDRVMELLTPFCSAAVIVKDFVKSRKHEWREACFIPSASDRAAIESVVRRFLELQDDDLNEGLVFREFVEFEPLTPHDRSGMPLTKEFRLFYLDGELMFWCPYWDQGDYQDLRPPLERFARVAPTVESRFFSMDVAKRRDGDWIIVELGDGQVAGLPENADADELYRSLANNWLK